MYHWLPQKVGGNDLKFLSILIADFGSMSQLVNRLVRVEGYLSKSCFKLTSL